MGLEQLGGLVAHQLEGLAAFDQRQTLRQQALQFHRADFRAVLPLLAPALRLFVTIEGALDPVGGAVEHIDRGPQQVFEIGFEARVSQRGDQGVEDVGEGDAELVFVGERSRVGVVLKGTVAVELEFGEDRRGGGSGVRRFAIGSAGHGVCLLADDRAHRGLPGDEDRERHGLAPPAPSWRRAAAAQRRTA